MRHRSIRYRDILTWRTLTERDVATRDAAASSATGGPSLSDLRKRYRHLELDWDRRVRYLTHGRLAVFLAGIAAFSSPWWWSASDGTAAILTGACVIGFVFLVTLHSRADERLRWYATLRTVADEAEARRHRRWDALPLDDTTPPSATHPYGGDLDLFGRRSLFHLLYAAGSALGLKTLRAWLLELPPRATTLSRQFAVRELSQSAALRLELAASGRLASGLRVEMLARFEGWAGSPSQLRHRPLLAAVAWTIPLSTLVLAVLQLTGVVGSAYWIAPAVMGVFVAGLTARRTSALIRRASLRASSLWHLADSFKLAGSTSCSAPALLDIRARIDSGEGASRQLRRLERITRLGEVRYSDLLHFLLHALCLLDLHVALRFERWRETSGSHVHSWFTALGEMEALCCLAELADGHPAWAFPTIRDAGGPAFLATAVAHPLLAPETAVPNDVRIDPGRFVFVTGSNMSGKSTLLRAIGVNAILARTGGPVCAASMELTASEIYTYVHVTDSLLDGVSGFMAGLLRLKALVERAGRVHDDGSSLLFLLDEPLQGTNPAERQLAIRRILRCLLGLGASGVITSHDLSLIDTDDLSRLASAVHFDERLDTDTTTKQSLVFDYQLRPGVCSSTNAIRLLDALGFPPDS